MFQSDLEMAKKQRAHKFEKEIHPPRHKREVSGWDSFLVIIMLALSSFPFFEEVVRSEEHGWQWTITAVLFSFVIQLGCLVVVLWKDSCYKMFGRITTVSAVGNVISMFSTAIHKRYISMIVIIVVLVSQSCIFFYFKHWERLKRNPYYMWKMSKMTEPGQITKA